MIFDSVQLGVPDIEATKGALETLLGIPATLCERGWRLQLDRGAVELRAGTGRLESLRFVRDGECGEAMAHGIHVLFDSPQPLPPPLPIVGSVRAIDHIVVHSSDLDRAIVRWRDDFGLRLALDRVFPARGVRLLFFRSGGVTIEFAGSAQATSGAAPGDDQLWGLAYRVDDLGSTRARLITAGMDISEIRPGRKHGTVVATVRSAPAGIPTLLIEEIAENDRES